MKRLLRKLLKALTPAFAVTVLALIGATAIAPDASAQVLRRGGGGVLSRDFWIESNGVLTPTNPNATIGSSSNRVSGIYTSSLDALTLTISGSVPGNLTVTGTITSTGGNLTTQAAVANIVCNGTNANCTMGQSNGTSGFLQIISGGDTSFQTWNGSAFTPRVTIEGNQAFGEVRVLGTLVASSTVASASSSLILPSGSASSLAFSFENNANTGFYQNGSGFFRLVGSQGIQIEQSGVLYQFFNGAFYPENSLSRDLGTSVNVWRNAFISNVSSTIVTSTRFTAGAGTLTQPSFALPGAGNGMYQDATDSTSIAAGGQRNFIVRATGLFSQVPFQPSSDLGTTLGTQTVRWSNLFSQNVSSTNMRVMTSIVSETGGVANLGTSASDRFGSLYAGLAAGTCTLCITGGSGYELYTLTGTLDIRTAAGNVKIGPGSGGNTFEAYSNAQESLTQFMITGDGNAIEFRAGNTSTKTFISNATSTQIIGWNNTPTSTLMLNKRACVAYADSDGSGTTYCTYNNGVQTCGTTDCR